jgi:membrane protein implicated in regulation of membrane protease activity
MAWWLWLVAGLGLLVVELVTPGTFYFLFFGFSALSIAVLAGLGILSTPWLEWLLFATLSAVGTLWLRGPLNRRVSTRSQPVDSIVGQTALALESISSQGRGKVELRGTSWSAHNVGEMPLAKGQRAKVEQVDGLTLNVRAE